MFCPACNATRRTQTRTTGVYTCGRCGCLYGQTYKGEASALVLPFMASQAAADAAQAAGTVKPFDLTCLGSDGVTRRHGFYDTVTRRVTQVG